MNHLVFWLLFTTSQFFCYLKNCSVTVLPPLWPVFVGLLSPPALLPRLSAPTFPFGPPWPSPIEKFGSFKVSVRYWSVTLSEVNGKFMKYINKTVITNTDIGNSRADYPLRTICIHKINQSRWFVCYPSRLRNELVEAINISNVY